MIKSVNICNFQSHKHTYLEFESGLNVLTGTSDHGKSAVIRAIGWVLHNKPSGDAYRTWGAKEDTVVTLTFDDGNVIVRRRGKKLNQYEVNGEVFKALRSDVPDEVNEITQMQDVNFQPQNEAYFLLNETPGNVAKKINAVADLAVMDATLQTSNKAVKSLKDDLKHVEILITSKKNQLTNMAYLDGMTEDMNGLTDTGAEIIQLDIDIDEVEVLITSTTIVGEDLDNSIPKCASKEAFELTKRQEEIIKHRVAVDVFAEVVESADDNAFLLEGYESVEDAARSLCTLIAAHNDIVTESAKTADVLYLTSLMKTKEVELKLYDDVDEAVEDLVELKHENNTLLTEGINLEVNSTFIHDLNQGALLMEEVKEKVEVEVNNFNKFKTELGVCPLCEGEM